MREGKVDDMAQHVRVLFQEGLECFQSPQSVLHRVSALHSYDEAAVPHTVLQPAPVALDGRGGSLSAEVVAVDAQWVRAVRDREA
jgi:hypothetical protein